jgi:hypothetical protein
VRGGVGRTGERARGGSCRVGRPPSHDSPNLSRPSYHTHAQLPTPKSLRASSAGRLSSRIRCFPHHPHQIFCSPHLNFQPPHPARAPRTLRGPSPTPPQPLCLCLRSSSTSPPIRRPHAGLLAPPSPARGAHRSPLQNVFHAHLPAPFLCRRGLSRLPRLCEGTFCRGVGQHEVEVISSSSCRRDDGQERGDLIICGRATLGHCLPLLSASRLPLAQKSANCSDKCACCAIRLHNFGLPLTAFPSRLPAVSGRTPSPSVAVPGAARAGRAAESAMQG